MAGIWSRLPKRKRLVAVTVIGALGFAVAATLFVRWSIRAPSTYRPGEPVNGLVAGLDRSLPPDYPRVVFTDVTREAGIRFHHFAGRRSSQLPEDMGSGAAWGDYDGDGWLDLYVVNEAGPLTLKPQQVAASPGRAALYHNERDGTFREVAEEAGVAFRGWGMAAAWADYDGDGHLDLVVTGYGQIVLYHNQGDGTFRDVTRRAGLAGYRAFWTDASWADYDRDGDLDLYVTGYVRYEPTAGSGASSQYDVVVPASLNPSAFPPERNLLFRNDGDGTFTETAKAAGVQDSEGRSLSAAWSDLDEDGWPDLYVANDISDNVLYRNRGDGTFEDVSHQALVADYRGAMGLALGDWNGDGDTDLFISHWLAQENALYDNKLRQGYGRLDAPMVHPLQFGDEADRWGLGQIALDYVGWGTSFLDYDNDGRADLMVVNGSTLQQAGAPELLAPMHDLLFWNRGARDGFYDVSSVAGTYFRQPYVGRGLAVADYDNDGDVDAFIVNNGGPAVLLRNDGGNRNGWLEVRLEGRRGNREGIGARVRILAGGAMQSFEVGAQSSYLSQDSRIAHFGLGPSGKVDTLDVRWPDGLRQRFHDVQRNRRLLLVEGDSLVANPAVPSTVRAEAVAPNPDVGTPPATVAATSAGSAGRSATQRFWELYREATARRIAGRPAEAEEAYQAALELQPGHENTLYYLGGVRLEQGDFRGAGEAWERLVRVNPRSARGYARLGELHSCLTPGSPLDLPRAEREFRRTLAINGEQVGPLLKLAVVALLRRTPTEAERRLDLVLGTDAKSAPAHFLKGYLAWRRGQRQAAAAQLRVAVEAAHAAPPLAGVAGDEDASGGGPGRPTHPPCGEVERESESLRGLPIPGGAAAEREMDAQYRRLQALLERHSATGGA